MTNQQAKAYIISQRNVNMATDNQHGVEACDMAIKALDMMNKPTGKWDRVYEDKWYFMCSRCHTKKLTASRYCPDCGSLNEEII